ncbi:MAG TPA: FecR family protein [Terracidiphilus sp.]
MQRIENHNGIDRRRNGALGLGWMTLLLGMLCLAPALRADDTATDGMGPGTRAVRLSAVEGTVKVTQGGQLVADQATINAPLFEGMQIATADDGRAEIQFEDGSVARLSPDSTLTLTALRGDGASGDAEITLNSGLAYFELQGTAQSGQMDVHFGDSTVTASGFTVFRLNTDAPPGELAVFSGNAHIESANGAGGLDLHGGESVKLTPGDPSHSVIAENIEPDSWDAWNSDRDQALNAEAGTPTGAANNVAPNESQNPAWNDLDANGNWYDVPGEGYVWSPYEAANAGWDPYGYGNWMYTSGYGYIWASGYPWGYLPYQCGAWNFYDGFGWGWAPGVGGCHPWWGGGYYPGIRFGRSLPGGYRPPHRPLPPRLPGPGRPIPMIAINRRGGGTVVGLPLRDRNTPVTIGGNTVHALQPLGVRPGFQRPASSFAAQEAHTYGNRNNADRPGNAPNRGAYSTMPSNGQYRPSPGVRSYAPPPSRSAPAQAGHPSYSGGARGGGGAPGGGGGASHGGGGGGASHGGGGGGGHK